MVMSRVRGMPDGIAGLVETITLVDAMNDAIEELAGVLERAARRLQGTGDAVLLWDVYQALRVGEAARAQARPIIGRLPW